MNDRERFLCWMRNEPVDRPPFWLFWIPWNTTFERWRREGMPASVKVVEDLWTFFDSDRLPIQAVVPVNTGPCPKVPKTVLAEDEDSITFVDSWGIVRRDLKYSESMSQFVKHPVQSRGDWIAFRDRYLNPDHPDRLAGNWREQSVAWTEDGFPIQLGWYPDAGLFGPYRWLLGDEAGLIGFHSEPELVAEIMDHLTSLYLTVFEQVVADVRVDVIHFWEDMCYRGGPLISPRHFQQFMAPNYRRVKDFADAHGIPIISVDTDGNPNLLAGPMQTAGVNFIYPMEVAAGCDVAAWRRKHPQLGLMGGIDKRALAEGPAAIDRELARVAPALEHGRYIPSLDHLIPDDVSWENYCYFVEALRKLVGKT